LFGVTDIVTEDTANYTCIVSGPHNVILASVTHLIQVRGLFLSSSVGVSLRVLLNVTSSENQSRNDRIATARFVYLVKSQN